MGHLDLMIGATLMTVNRAAHFEAAERRLLKALTFDPNHANAHLNLAGVYIFTNRAIEEECRAATMR